MAREIGLSNACAGVVSAGKFYREGEWAHSQIWRHDFRLTIPMGEL